jgi:type IV pilus assembly protein PilP
MRTKYIAFFPLSVASLSLVLAIGAKPAFGQPPSSADATLPNSPPTGASEPAKPSDPAAVNPAQTNSQGGGQLENTDPNFQSPQLTIFSGMMDPFDYDPRGRRDPFGQPIPDIPMSQGGLHGPLLPLQRFELNQLRLTGILWDVRQPKAILKDPSGAIYIVGPNAKIGPRNGYVAVIREGEIVVVETVDLDGRLVSTAQVVKIAK